MLLPLFLLIGCPQPKSSPDLPAEIDALKEQLAAVQGRIPEGEAMLATADAKVVANTLRTIVIC